MSKSWKKLGAYSQSSTTFKKGLGVGLEGELSFTLCPIPRELAFTFFKPTDVNDSGQSFGCLWSQRKGKNSTMIWPRLFERWIQYPQDKSLFNRQHDMLVNTYLLKWIAIYPVDSIIQPSTNLDLICYLQIHNVLEDMCVMKTS